MLIRFYKNLAYVNTDYHREYSWSGQVSSSFDISRDVYEIRSDGFKFTEDSTSDWEILLHSYGNQYNTKTICSKCGEDSNFQDCCDTSVFTFKRIINNDIESFISLDEVERAMRWVENYSFDDEDFLEVKQSCIMDLQEIIDYYTHTNNKQLEFNEIVLNMLKKVI